VTEENALPTGESAEAGQTETPEQIAATAALTEKNRAIDEADKPEGEKAEGESAKKEKTPEQREIERLRRRVDNLTRQKYELRAGQQQPVQQQTPANDEEPVTLSRAEIERMVAERAAKLAPTISEQKSEIERRQAVVKSLAKTWGQEEFDAKASDLDAVFNGLADTRGRPKPATDAIFEADDPKAVIEYLTDPDNADEAERIASLSPSRAAREITLLDAKLKTTPDKPQPSKAAKPIEAIRGQGIAQKEWTQLSDKEFFERRRKFSARR
jgi:hypothetical protein